VVVGSVEGSVVVVVWLDGGSGIGVARHWPRGTKRMGSEGRPSGEMDEDR